MNQQEERFEKAMEIQTELFGEEDTAAIRAGAARGYRTKAMQDYVEITLGHGFVDMWSRPGLEMRGRRLAQIAGLMGMRQWIEFEVHVRLGLQNELTADEVIEVLLQMTVYGGQAMGHTAFPIINKVFKELGIDERKG